ncbi:MAG: hypothetical protein AAB316_04385 [Bacteroidota bacterium]
MLSKQSWEGYSIEEALQIPALKHLAEKLIEDAKDPQKGYRRPKYLQAQKSHTRVLVQELLLEHPDWQLKDLLLEIVKGYPDDLPSDVLLQCVQFITEAWEKSKIVEDELAMA